MILIYFYLSNIDSLSSPIYKKRTRNEIKTIQKKRRSGGKNLIYDIRLINKLIMLFDIK